MQVLGSARRAGPGRGMLDGGGGWISAWTCPRARILVDRLPGEGAVNEPFLEAVCGGGGCVCLECCDGGSGAVDVCVCVFLLWVCASVCGVGC